jgi:lipopolysaccharide/colanic/teichoic acid biosynthesis glycosyltransferase
LITLITVIHVFVCVFLILVILLQAGKGGGILSRQWREGSGLRQGEAFGWCGFHRVGCPSSAQTMASPNPRAARQALRVLLVVAMLSTK